MAFQERYPPPTAELPAVPNPVFCSQVLSCPSLFPSPISLLLTHYTSFFCSLMGSTNIFFTVCVLSPALNTLLQMKSWVMATGPKTALG